MRRGAPPGADSDEEDAIGADRSGSGSGERCSFARGSASGEAPVRERGATCTTNRHVSARGGGAWADEPGADAAEASESTAESPPSPTPSSVFASPSPPSDASARSRCPRRLVVSCVLGQNATRTRFVSPGASVPTCGLTTSTSLASLGTIISNVSVASSDGFLRNTDPATDSRTAVGGSVRRFPPGVSNGGNTPHPAHGSSNSRAPSNDLTVTLNSRRPTRLGAKRTRTTRVSPGRISPNLAGAASTSSGNRVNPNCCISAPGFVTRSRISDVSPTHTFPKRNSGGSNARSAVVTTATTRNDAGMVCRDDATRTSTASRPVAASKCLGLARVAISSALGGRNLSENTASDLGWTKR